MVTRTHQSLIGLSIAAAVVTLGLKTGAYWLTGSVGLLSDALESIINLVAALIAYVSIWYSARPADRTHMYGHSKVEFFSSGIEGWLIVVAAGAIAWYAVQRLLHPQPLEQLDLGLLVSLVAAGINYVVARMLIRVGRAEHAIVLEADGQHLMTDVWTSAAVLVALAVVWATNWVELDPIIAIGIAINIVWTGMKLVGRSIDGLMDRALPEEELTKLRAAIQTCLEPEMAFHALRTRRAGTKFFADFHLLVPGAWTVRRAHTVAHQVEEAARAALPGLEVTVHVEPIEEQSSWEDNPIERAEIRG
jgi:cation diffusion facilitator family transporter